MSMIFWEIAPYFIAKRTISVKHNGTWLSLSVSKSICMTAGSFPLFNASRTAIFIWKEPSYWWLSDSQGRHQLPEGSSRGQEGWAWWAAERIHQRMAQTTFQGRGGTQASEGKASQAQGDPRWAGEKIGSAKEGRGGKAPQVSSQRIFDLP